MNPQVDSVILKGTKEVIGRKMNPQINTIVLKEVKEVTRRRDYIFTIILNIIVFAAVGCIFAQNYEVASLRNLFLEMTFLVMPPFAMYIVSVPFIKEKFSDEKILRRFEALLTVSVSLKTLWASKMISIFLLSYPVVLAVIVIFSAAWGFLGGLNPFLVMSSAGWIMALFIMPMVPMAYAAFSSWSVLRFTHPKLMEILNFFAVGIAVLVFISSGHVLRLIATGHIVNWLVAACTAIIIAAAFGLVLVMINRLDKEKITI